MYINNLKGIAFFIGQHLWEEIVYNIKDGQQLTNTEKRRKNLNSEKKG